MHIIKKIEEFTRWFVTGTKHWITFSPTSRPRRVLRNNLIALKHNINAHPGFKTCIMHILKPFPKLEARLKRIGKVDPVPPSMKIAGIETGYVKGMEQLSPCAQKIYHDIKEAIAHREKEER